jgi:hypothetical protein
MAASYTFAQSSSIGTVACQLTTQYFQEHGFRVDDIQNNRFFQKLDVDLNVVDFGLVEVKGDTYRTGNVFVEVIANAEKGRPGAMTYTQADYLFYYFLAEGRALLIPVAEMKAWIASGRAQEFPRKTSYTHTNAIGHTYHCIGHVVPWEVMLEEIEGTQHIEGLPVWDKRKKG